MKAYGAIYESSLCSVNVNGVLTPFYETVVGTRQGDQSSPNLFNCFLQSLLDELENSGVGVGLESGEVLSVLAYADDILLMAESERDLQILSDIVHDWSRRWRMTVNLSKTKIVIYRGRRITIPDCNVLYGLERVEVVSGYRYLGVYLDEFLTLNEYATQIASAGGRALGAVLNKVRFLREIGHRTYGALYHSGVASVLDYGAEIAMLSKKSMLQLERVQYRAGRFFLGVGRHSALCSINAELGWRSCQSRGDMSKFRYFNRILSMNSDRIPRRVFMECKDKTGTWANEIGNALIELGMAEHWHRNIPLDLSLVSSKISSRDEDRWKVEVDSKRKLDYFKTVKTDLKASTFVRCNIPKAERSILSRLRNGSLMLRLEYGRYNRELRQDRICELCKDGVEDARHFLFDCEKLNICRQRYSDLIKNQNEVFEHPFQLGKFVKELWDKRRQLLK